MMMVEWLNLTSGVRLARNDKLIRVVAVAAGFIGCFVLALIF